MVRRNTVVAGDLLGWSRRAIITITKARHFMVGDFLLLDSADESVKEMIEY